MKWAHPVAKFWQAGAVIVVLAGLGVLLHAQSVDAAPATGASWLNRMYLVDNAGQNYYDSNTYDNNYEYVEQNPVDGCADKILFVFIGGGGDDPLRNSNFFYKQSGNNNAATIPNNFWQSQLVISTKYTSGSGGQVCGTLGSSPNGFSVQQNLPIASPNNRRITFYQNTQDKIISFKSGATFSRKGDFKGVPRYYRDDEVADTNNSCPDIILLHPANIKTSGESIFGRGEIAGSSMLYAVRKDDQLSRKSESYDRVSEPNSINTQECRVETDSINGRKGGTYGISGYDDNDDDVNFLAGGLQDSGAPATGGGEDDDAVIIFVGNESNVPKDATGAPIANGGVVSDGGDKVDEQTCKGGAMGWIICPIISGIQTALNLLRDTMQYFLIVNPLPIGSGGIYETWNNIRNFANIAFVLAFFAVIFSQATSIGISNYGIKRLLPRLVLIAIATNLSYFVCSFMVDAFNILGIGITNLFALANNGSAGTINVSNEAGSIFTSGIVAGLTWALLTGNIVQIFGLIVIAFIGFLITFVILVIRQAIIILLVVFSPLAFVAGLLPGTQNWFRQWFEMFSTLLLMYPLIMAMFAAARLASAILTAAAGA